MYNMTNITNANALPSIISELNKASNGSLMQIFLLVLFFGFLVVFKKQDFKKALLADGVFIFIISIMGWGLGYISFMYIVISLIVVGVSLIAFMFTE